MKSGSAGGVLVLATGPAGGSVCGALTTTWAWLTMPVGRRVWLYINTPFVTGQLVLATQWLTAMAVLLAGPGWGCTPSGPVAVADSSAERRGPTLLRGVAWLC